MEKRTDKETHVSMLWKRAQANYRYFQGNRLQVNGKPIGL